MTGAGGATGRGTGWLDRTDTGSALDGVRVLDFSTLLPGPLATLMLAEQGADVLKVERADTGDEMRHVGPFAADGSSIRFTLLNAGKRSVALDLKSPAGVATARALAREADVVVEGFRPGVMDRLGLGADVLREDNPRLVYCPITGYGQDGPRAHTPGHDLNFAAELGLLSLVRDADGAPPMPATTWADIGGGSYPAVLNVLLALLRRERTGVGAHLDVAMAENLLTFVYWGVAAGGAGRWPTANGEVVTGGSPRYGLYRAADGRWLAVAALEDRFWHRFCAAVGLEPAVRDDPDPTTVRAAVATRLAARTSTEWEAVLAAAEACVSPVRDLADAVGDEHVVARGVLAGRVATPSGETLAAVHVPLAGALRRPPSAAPPRAPDLPAEEAP
ncbi:CaiB/BaiF CoA-transferase family protein [Actinomycetospora sp. TBRC 11914]|uniref:CaiB/BaiF CoA transferase family protein n=1 Tax=Actinomycetospora sp. TBRC 11914 TaxID=2729387 RepID=UPI00145E0976|nr:CoA transferase [Actinomycetospora sp. TBRC 11914]NMO88273.1 CoA transferase [Actinomycetospora sp. TBRC 11914]